MSAGHGLRTRTIAFAACTLVAGCASPGPITPPPGLVSPATTTGVSPSANAPLGSPTPALTPVPTQPSGGTIEYDGPDGPILLELVDTGVPGAAVRTATSAEQSRGTQSVSDDTDTGVVALGPTEVLVSWVGTICETGWRVVVDAPGHLTIGGTPRKPCDLAREYYHAVLTYPNEIDASRINVTLRPPVLTGG